MPDGWVWTTLGEIAESNIGLTYKPSDVSEIGIPVYRSNNIQDRKICLDNLVRVQSTILPKQYLNEGDLLICARNGSRNLVGKCALITELCEPTSFGAFMAVCRSIFNPWIYFVLNSNYFNQYLNDSNSTAINQVTQKMLLSFLIPLPPIKQQKRIVTEVKNWFSVIDGIEKGKDYIVELISQTKSKILNMAIHGKLVPQDPADEPAIELLKRVNPNAEITSDNEHYPQLPAGWCIAPMKILCSLEDGRKEKNNERFNIDVKFLRGERDAKIINNGRYICANSLLILVDGENSGEVFRTPIDGYQGSTFKRLIINELMCEEYLLNVISLHRKVLRENKVGSAIPHLNKKLFKEIEVPIPPYNEQKRIAKTIKTLFNNIDNIAENL